MEDMEEVSSPFLLMAQEGFTLDSSAIHVFRSQADIFADRVDGSVRSREAGEKTTRSLPAKKKNSVAWKSMPQWNHPPAEMGPSKWHKLVGEIAKQTRRQMKQESLLTKLLADRNGLRRSGGRGELWKKSEGSMFERNISQAWLIPKRYISGTKRIRTERNGAERHETEGRRTRMTRNHETGGKR